MVPESQKLEVLTKTILASRDPDQPTFLTTKHEAKNHCLLSINQSADCLPDMQTKNCLEDTKTSFSDPKISENAETQPPPHRIQIGDPFIPKADHVPDATSH